MKKKKMILAVLAHPDDESFGVGGTGVAVAGGNGVALAAGVTAVPQPLAKRAVNMILKMIGKIVFLDIAFSPFEIGIRGGR